MTYNKTIRGTFASLCSTVALIALSGCAASISPIQDSVEVGGMHGTVMGGQQPVGFSSIQIYAVGTTGYGSPATPLLNRPVTTDQYGNFNLTGTFTCPSPSTQVYMAVTGGNPGLPAGTNNQAIAIVGMLGPCGNLGPNTSLYVNELTTVAAAYAMAPFTTSISAIGTSATNYTGITNAVTTSSSLVSANTGAAPGTIPAIATVPKAEIYTLGDILSSCVNSNGSTAPGSPCGNLFTYATPPGGTPPTDIFSAAVDIALNPGHNVGSLFTLSHAIGPYQPTLSSAPADWSIAINYTSTNFKSLADIAIDSQSNAWVLSTKGNASNVNLLNTGGIAATYSQPSANYMHVAIDAFDDAWLSNTTYSNIVVLTSSGSTASVNPYTGGGVNGPGALGFDASGNAWIVNNNTSISKLSPSGSPISPSTGYSVGGISGPIAIALDFNNDAWVVNSGANSITRLTAFGSGVAGVSVTGGGLNGPFAVALDSATNIWVANRTGSSITKFSSAGVSANNSPFTGGGVNSPVAIAVDGLGNVWTANSGGNSLSKFANSGSPVSGNPGYGSAFLSTPYKFAIDNSGSLWVINLGSTSTTTNTVTQLVGIAAPVTTPVAVAVQDNQVGQRP